MENDGEESGEKMVFVVIWLRVEKRKDFGRWDPQVSFLTLPKHNLPNWEKIWEKSGQKYLDKIAPN